MADHQGDEGPNVCQDAVGGTTYREAAMITWRFVKTKIFLKQQMEENSLQKNSDVFHLGRTWFKTNNLGRKMRIEECNFHWVPPSRILKVPTLPHPSVPWQLSLGVVSPACRPPGFGPRLHNLSQAQVLRAPQPLWPSLRSSDECVLTWPRSDTPATKSSEWNNVNVSDLKPNTDRWGNMLREDNSSPVT